jgi:hypothetical protein
MAPIAAIGLAQGVASLIPTIGGLFGRAGKKKAADKAAQGIQTFADSPYGKQILQQAEADVNQPMPGEEQAKQAIGGATTRALNAAKTRKGALMVVGSAQAQEQKGLEDLATKKAQFKIGAKQRLAGVQEKAFQSKQQKEAMNYQRTLAELSANRQTISQGLSGLGQGIGTFAYGGGFEKTIPGEIPADIVTGNKAKLDFYSPETSQAYKNFQRTMMPTTLTGKISGYKPYSSGLFKSLQG